MEANGEERIGPALGAIGSIVLIFFSSHIFFTNIQIQITNTFYVTNLVVGFIGLIGAYYGLTKNRTNGALIMLISGVLALVAIFFALMNTIFLIEPTLLITGGIVGFISKNFLKRFYLINLFKS